MNIEGDYTFDAPQELVWRMLLDPAVLAKVMPNCQALEKVGDDEYEGKMKIQVGPVQGVFQGKVKLSNMQPPNGYRMQVVGKGPAGMVDGEGDVRLEAADGKTVMHYTGEAKVSGKIASIGQRLMDTSARAITKQSLENLEKQILAHQSAQTAPVEAGEPPADVAVAADVESATPKARAKSGAKRKAKATSGSARKTTDEPTVEPAATIEPDATTKPAPVRLSEPAASTAPQPEVPPPTPFQYAAAIARELLNEFVPADKQKWLFLAVGLLLVYLYTKWLTNRIADRVAEQLKKTFTR